MIIINLLKIHILLLQIYPKYRLHLVDNNGIISVSDQVAETCDACDRNKDLRVFLFCTKYMEKNMPKKAIKPFIIYSDQLNVLTQKNNLIFLICHMLRENCMILVTTP